MSSIQLALFDQGKTERIPEPDKPTFLEWSYSRRGVLEQCPRKYYYQYYGSSSMNLKIEIHNRFVGCDK